MPGFSPVQADAKRRPRCGRTYPSAMRYCSKTVLLLPVALLLLVACGATPSPTATFSPAATATVASADTAELAAAAEAAPSNTPVATATSAAQGGAIESETPAPLATANGAQGGSIKKATPIEEPLPSPSATVAAVATGPAATAAPPTATSAPTATPVPASPYAIAPVFAQAAAMQYDVPVPYGYTEETGTNSLGAPQEDARQVPLARQWFGPFHSSICNATDSLMVWRGDTREIAFLVEGNPSSGQDCYPGWWQAIQDTWQEGEPNNDEIEPPVGYYRPVMGFGKVWRQLRDTQYNEIGLATTPEEHTDGTVQRFENGTACYFPDTGEVYILFDKFRRVARNGETYESLVWYHVE